MIYFVWKPNFILNCAKSFFTIMVFYVLQRRVWSIITVPLSVRIIFHNGSYVSRVQAYGFSGSSATEKSANYYGYDWNINARRNCVNAPHHFSCSQLEIDGRTDGRTSDSPSFVLVICLPLLLFTTASWSTRSRCCPFTPYRGIGRTRGIVTRVKNSCPVITYANCFPG